MTDHTDHSERADLLQALRTHRDFFRTTLRGLDEQGAAAHPTVSELCLGGLAKHLADVERGWCRFVLSGPEPGDQVDWTTVDWSDPPAQVRDFLAMFQMGENDTLAGVLAAYDEAAAATDALVGSVDLDQRWPLPEAPWNEPGATWSARRVFVHLVGETAQHAGHADILRETIDGQKTMG